MDRKLETLLAERETLAREFSAQSLALHLCFITCAVIFYLSIILYSPIAAASSYAMLTFFALVELGLRKRYIELRSQLDKEVERLSGVRLKRKRIVGFLPWGE